MEDTFYPIRWILRVYKLVGLWHEEPYEIPLKIYGLVLHTFVTTLFIFAMIVDLILKGPSNLGGFDVSLTFCEIALYTKVINLFFANKTLRSIISELDSKSMQPQNSKEIDIYFKNSEMKGVNVTAIIYYVVSLFCFGASIATALIWYFNGIKMCLHSNWFYGFYCSNGGNLFDYVFFFQLGSMCMHCFINITTDMFISTVLARLVGQLAILGAEIESLKGVFTVRETYDCVNKLKGCIKRHNQIIELKERFQDCFQYTVFAQTMVSSIVICTSAYDISSNRPDNITVLITIVTFTGAMIAQVGIPCYYGSNLYYASQELSFNGYCSGWERLSPEFGANLLLLMIQAGRPIQFKALSLLKLNLDTFLWVLQKSYSLFAVLQNMN